MRILYKQPKEIMNDILFQQYHNNEYFDFMDFAGMVNATDSHYPISDDMMKDFIFEMIDQKKIAQEYVGNGVSPMLTDEQKKDAPNKYVRLKLIAQQP